MATIRAFQIPSSTKLNVLKAVATKCGIQTTGTKSVLLDRLQNEIASTSTISAKKTIRVLSIDMGIRNLAYCVLDVPPSKVKLSHGQNEQRPHLNMGEVPILQAWHRLAVSSAPTPDPSASIPISKEAFDPATLSALAYNILRHRLLLLKPDIVLIERQRFRSMGSKHILEWTIRVNMFESILYAILHTLRTAQLWYGKVIPITPGRVGPFWVGAENEFLDEDEKVAVGKKKVRTSKNAKVRNKGAKIDLVRTWCESSERVAWGNAEVKNTVGRYVEKWDRRPGGRRKGTRIESKNNKDAQAEEKMGKLDDLADCLLQAMAWVEWEKNKELALNYGYEVLLDAT